MMNNDVYRISARIKNLIAREDIALSKTGGIMVNYFTLILKDLYDFSETLDTGKMIEMQDILTKAESVPLHIILATTPEEEPILEEETPIGFDYETPIDE